MKPRVLIVGTVPYNERSTSRAFDSYFHFWKRENLAQIFSNTKTPIKGHCETLYQITDQRMLKRWLGSKNDPGVIFHYDDLPNYWDSNDLEVNSRVVTKLYGIGSHKNSLVYLIRWIIWRKRFWHTKKLDTWLDTFNPECVFLAFSDDFFIPQIALYVAERYNIPIVSCIGDDYYFNYKKTLSPFYHMYKLMYRHLVRKVFRHRGSAVYIGDKIRDKYNSEFGLNGETVYLTSSIERRSFREIDKENPHISYFGNVRLGRNKSLKEIGQALAKINSNYTLDIYSNETDKTYIRLFQNIDNICFHGSVSYSEVQKKMLESDIVIVVEGFKQKDVGITRYSLSTKVADSLASGVNVFAYGSFECGAIEYAEETGCIVTCTDKEQLSEKLRELIENLSLQKQNYQGSISITEKNHRLSQSTAIFENIINGVCGENINAKR